MGDEEPFIAVDLAWRLAHPIELMLCEGRFFSERPSDDWRTGRCGLEPMRVFVLARRSVGSAFASVFRLI